MKNGLTGTVVGLYFLLLGLAVASLYYVTDQRSADRSETLRRAFTGVCERNNITKADNRVKVRSARTAFSDSAGWRAAVLREDRLLVLLDCPATFHNAGIGVPLSHSQEEKFIAIIAQGQVPELHDGRVVGSHEPESGKADF